MRPARPSAGCAVATQQLLPSLPPSLPACPTAYQQDQERLYLELKQVLARQPGPEAAEQLSAYQARVRRAGGGGSTGQRGRQLLPPRRWGSQLPAARLPMQASLRDKGKQLKALASELHMYQAQVGAAVAESGRELVRTALCGVHEAPHPPPPPVRPPARPTQVRQHKHEIERLHHEMREVKGKYFEMKRAARGAGSAGDSSSEGGSVFGGKGPSEAAAAGRESMDLIPALHSLFATELQAQGSPLANASPGASAASLPAVML